MGAGIFLFLAELLVVVYIQVAGPSGRARRRPLTARARPPRQVFVYSPLAAYAASALSVPMFIGFIYIGVQLSRREARFMAGVLSRRQQSLEECAVRMKHLSRPHYASAEQEPLARTLV